MVLYHIFLTQTKNVKYKKWGTKIDDLAIDELKELMVSEPKSETDEDLESLKQKTQAEIDKLKDKWLKKAKEVENNPTQNIKRETSYVKPRKTSSKYDVSSVKPTPPRERLNDPRDNVVDPFEN